jgi:hypothetical protein
MAARIVQNGERHSALRRWLPAVLPAVCFLIAGGLLLWSLTWLPGGRTAGQEVAQARYLQSVVVALVLLIGAAWAVRSSDRDPQWRLGAWFCSVLAAIVLVV